MLMQMYVVAVLVVPMLLPSVAQAQVLDEAFVRSRAQLARDLKFPEQAKSLGVFSALEMAIYKPEGAGPFPALLLMHTCGGLTQHIQEWTKRAMQRGYVVFVIDSLTQRGLKENCAPGTSANPFRGEKDAFDALEHLKQFAFVDQQRIGLVGFSWGAFVGLLASSQEMSAAFAKGKRFGGIVAFYPYCTVRLSSGTLDFLRSDITTPLLLLLGDADPAPVDCVPKLETLKNQGAPVEWHVYPGATHRFESSETNGVTRRNVNGEAVAYRYDKTATDDSIRRVFEFFERRLKSAQ